MSRNRIIIELQPEDDRAEVHALAGVLKRLLRGHGWRCTRIGPADPDPDLDRLTAVWPSLPPHLRQCILRLATANGDDAAEVVAAMQANQQRIDDVALARLGAKD